MLTGLPVTVAADRVRTSRVPSETLLLELGDAAERLATASLNRAVAASARLIEIADAAGGPLARARVRRAAAHSLNYSGRFAEALELSAQAFAIASEASEPIEAARARLAAVHALASLGRFDDALAAGEAARTALLDLGDAALAARADLNLGAVQAMRDEPRLALVHLDRARPAFADDPATLAALESNRGNALMGLDDFAAAEDAFASAAAAFQAGAQPLLAAIAEGNLAYLATRQGRLPAALYHFERARRLFEQEAAPAHLARLEAEQAQALAILGLPEDALAIFERVLPRLDLHGLASEAAAARAALGDVLHRLERIGEAQDVLTEAETAFRSLGQQTALGRVGLAKGEILAEAGHLDQARRTVETALTLMTDRPAEAARGQALRARLALNAGNRTAAELAVEAAIGPSERLGLAPVLADLHLTRGRLHRLDGDLVRARDSFRAAVDQVERVRGALQAGRFRAAYLADRLAPYNALIAAALDADTDDARAEAFVAIERAKSRSLLDTLEGAFAGEADDPEHEDAGADVTVDTVEAALRGTLARLRAELNWRYSRLADAGPDEPRAVGGAWARELRTLEGEIESVQTRLAAAQRPTGLFAPTVTLSEVRRVLPPKTGLLEYYVTGDDVLAILVQPGSDGETRVYRRLASVREVVERLHRVRFQIGRALTSGASASFRTAREDRLADDARRALSTLGHHLLGPIAADIEELHNLVVVPHGPLHAVPFHALLTHGAFLIEQMTIAQLPSGSLLVRLAGQPTPDSHRDSSLVVGVIDTLAPEISLEVEQTAAALGASKVLRGPAATVSGLRSALPGMKVVHLACHGRFSRNLPGASGLKLADRWLTLHDAADLPLDGAHVTLSGCDTGRTTVSAGDELVGLPRSLFAAGAVSTLVSLWPVHDAATVELMAIFYRTWRQGAGRAAALRNAQLATLAARPHPAYWAPFVLGGIPWIDNSCNFGIDP